MGVIRYSVLRYKPGIQFLLFLLTTGILVFFSQKMMWLAFSISLTVAGAVYAALLYVESRSFSARLDDLRERDFQVASLMDRVGAREIFLMSDPEQQLTRNRRTQEILRNGNRFSLCTLTAASYIDPAVDRHWPILKARLDEGCVLRLILQDPLSQEKRVRDKRNRPGGAIDNKLDLEAVIGLKQLYGDQVQVRFVSTSMYAAIFFSETELTYDPYHLGMVDGRVENRFWTFTYAKRLSVEPARYDHYALLCDHFEYLWAEISVNLMVYLADYEEELGKLLSPGAVAGIRIFLRGDESPQR